MRRDNEFRYSRLANMLREQIVSGYIKPGQFLLSENELCKYYGMSRTSVRKSLEQLHKEGLIVKKVGQGTIVSPDFVPSPGEKRTLRILATSPSHYVDNCLGTIIEAFQARYPQIDVKLLHFPSFNFWDWQRTGAELGVRPDLVLVTDRSFAESDRLDPFIDLGDKLPDLLDGFYPRIVEPFRHEGVLRALPVTFSPVFLAYNPRLFRRFGVQEPHPGWSREHLIEAAGQLTRDEDGDGVTDLYGLSLSSFPSRWPVVALQNGVKFDASASRESIIETLKLFRDVLHRKRIATLYQPYRSKINLHAFLREKAAMVLTTSIEIAGWRSEGMTFEAKVAPLPFGPVKSTLLVANAFMIHKDSDDPELALEFLRIALDPGLQTELARDTGFMSCLPDVNAAVWNERHLESLNIAGRHIENGYFLHELFADSHRLDDLSGEMELFWAGLEQAEPLADRIIGILSGTT